MSLFRFEKVTKIYPPYFKALLNINLEIKRGEFIVLTGPTGAGKTTLLKLIYREEIPTEGEIFWEGVPYRELSYSKLTGLRRKLGIVFQDHRLFNELTVYENILISLALSDKKNSKTKFLIYEWLERFNLAHKSQKKVQELSGGEQQKIGLIRALIREPEVLLLDEPTGNLDPQSLLDMLKILQEYHRKGCTIVLSTHDPTIISKRPGKLIFLNQGSIIKDASYSY